MRPFLVWHSFVPAGEWSDPKLTDVSKTRRYLVWAESPRAAVDLVVKHKETQGRLPATSYYVHSIKGPGEAAVHELQEDGQPDIEFDLDLFEGLFEECSMVTP